MTFEQSFKKAFKDTRKTGVTAKMQVWECCRGCINKEKLGMNSDSDPYVYTYAGQGSRLRFDGDSVVYADSRSSVPHIYVYHGNGGGEKFAEVAKSLGLDVEWDGSQWSAIVVKVPNERMSNLR
ncbi:hypothetical protein SEA_STARBOW_132 [Streptomyces phage Starbow]|uniref:Uncharacterized protein n=3 Tax=Streptomyces virus Karimac TaxID=2846401 RepID=A0A5Q2WKU6_9CAUD|nr:hypothetical protein SEA_STARBOW_132 [Streptomyces phage Starbow]QGH79890.1 hypothetical protein SEA_BORDEAUX_133 [Streptomyces phage Bordeaux]QRI45808.1 hypothetical protein SEA_BATTUTA_133 [Streptomyces phage Battuta]